MGEQGEQGNGGMARHAFPWLAATSAMLLAAGATPVLARTAASEIIPATVDATPDAMVREASDTIAPAAGIDPRAVLDPATDGIADWIVPRVAVAPTVWSFPTVGSDYEPDAQFGTVDGARFREHARSAEPSAPFTLAGIGFPHVETTPTTSRRHHRRFTRLLDWRGARVPRARVRCMGLSSHAVARRAARYAPTIERLADQHGLAPSLVMAVVARESCFDPRAVSRAGAIGLMQLMPATARELREGDPRKPANNLRAGVRYLAAMHERFGSTELALAAYNAGPGNVRRYGGIPPFAETRAYVHKVLAYARRYRALELVASL